MHSKSVEDIKTLVMGVQFGSKTICEFDIDENGLDELYTSKNSSFLNFASAVYCDRHLYISGGT